MSGITPIGPTPIDPAARQHGVERVRERYYDDPEQPPEEEERRRRRKKPSKPASSNVPEEHVDVRA